MTASGAGQGCDRIRDLEAALRPFAALLDTESNGYESSPDDEVVR